jgi:hypothetical protein
MTTKSVMLGARRGFLLVPIAISLAWFALSPVARAVNPAPDGGYPNGNTAEGQDALKLLSTGANNTALGFEALGNNTTGSQNTATGSLALFSNTTGSQNTATGLKALTLNQSGSFNTATGGEALLHNTRGTSNTATGFEALFENKAETRPPVHLRSLATQPATKIRPTAKTRSLSI